MNEQKRKTVGALSSELLQKQTERLSPIDLEREMHKDYEKNLIECVQSFKKNHTGDFFVKVITKREPLMPNVLRNYFVATLACPTPTYDEAVYHYSAADENIVFLWVVPCKEACILLRNNALEVVPEERELLGFVLDFYSGELDKKAKKFNGEKEDSIFIEN